MKDRAMTVGECECCFGIRYLDELIRLQLVDATKNYDVLNMVLCPNCKEHKIDWWWNVDPKLYRYYHPA